LAGRNYLSRIHHWRTAGYKVSLYFLMLESPELAIARVANRCAKVAMTCPAGDPAALCHWSQEFS
jgi:predicted ABC-type ATPase